MTFLQFLAGAEAPNSTIEFEVINRFYETEDSERIPINADTYDKTTEEAFLHMLKDLMCNYELE